jgi:hypothetical protein
MSGPTLNGDNGKDEKGKFAAGNKYGSGNPFAKQVNQLRSALLKTIEPEDIIAIVKILIKKAKAGNILCIKEVLDRSLGKPIETDLLQRLEDLEDLIAEKESNL